MTLRRAAVVTMLLATLWAGDVRAQRVRPSQRGSVSQMLGETTITLVYNRPVARGRTLFGDVVPWGRLWHPGANEATTIEVSDDILISDRELPAGRYSLWVHPSPDRWTWIFSRRSDVWHTRYPGESQDALRITLAPAEASHMETMTYYFPVVAADSAVLAFHWGTTIVEMPLRVKPRS